MMKWNLKKKIRWTKKLSGLKTISKENLLRYAERIEEKIGINVSRVFFFLF